MKTAVIPHRHWSVMTLSFGATPTGAWVPPPLFGCCPLLSVFVSQTYETF